MAEDGDLAVTQPMPYGNINNNFSHMANIDTPAISSRGGNSYQLLESEALKIKFYESLE